MPGESRIIGAKEATRLMRPGTKVTQMTRKVGQVPRTGTVKAVHGDSVEVRWDDGRTTITSRSGLAISRGG
jgi:hypothetical protein